MGNLKEATGIKKNELLYHLLNGLNEVSKILKRNPEDPQLKEVSFVFSIEKTRAKSGKIQIFIGFSSSNSKTYNSIDTVTYEFHDSKKIAPKYQRTSFEWKERGFNLQLEFAGYIMRRISDYILADRELQVEGIKQLKIEDKFAIVKGKSGILQLKFFDEMLELEGKIGSEIKLSQEFSIILE